jgi:hypothetical protein
MAPGQFQDPLTSDTLTKEVMWNTAGLFGGEWRVGVSRDITKP